MTASELKRLLEKCLVIVFIQWSKDGIDLTEDILQGMEGERPGTLWTTGSASIVVGRHMLPFLESKTGCDSIPKKCGKDSMDTENVQGLVQVIYLNALTSQNEYLAKTGFVIHFLKTVVNKTNTQTWYLIEMIANRRADDNVHSRAAEDKQVELITFMAKKGQILT